MIRHIPNLLTLANLACGCAALIAILSHSNLPLAAALVVLAAMFDFFDGFAARLLKVSGEMGKQLDSLADMVTFGVVPSAAMHHLMFLQKENVEWLSRFPLAVYIPILIALFSALRLAKFNIDTRQSDSFIGLPTPANALFWMSWGVILMPGPICFCMDRPIEAGFLSDHWMANPAMIAVGTVVFSMLLVAELPLIALKFKHFRLIGNELRYMFIGLSIGALVLGLLFFGNLFAGILIVILLYLLISVIGLRTKPQQ